MSLSGRPLQSLRVIRLGALASLSCLMGCGLLAPPPDIRPQDPNVVSLDPNNWYIYYSAGMPLHPSADSEGAWSFEIPTIKTGHVNYVQTPFNATTTLNSVSITFKSDSATPVYDVLDPSDIPPATFHLFFEQRDD